MKRLRAGCILWVLITTCILMVTWVAQAIHAPAQQLALTGIIHNNVDIFLMDVMRSLAVNLTHSTGDESFPAWSPDAQQLIFYSERSQRTDLYMMNISDGKAKRLVASGGPAASPAWSPDGEWIAYATLHQPNVGLYLVRPDGGDIRRLTDFQVVSIVWSPDSRQIAFVGNCEGNCDIFVVSVATGKVRQLTHNGLIDAYPAWSPDSQQLAFISNRSMSFELYVIDIDCDETRQGGCTTRRLTQNRAADSFPSWSPDGNQIAFSSDRSGNYEVYTVAANCFGNRGGCNEQATPITHRDETDILPLWSPDGTKIAFLTADHSAHFNVYVVDVAEQTLHALARKLPHDGIVV